MNITCEAAVYLWILEVKKWYVFLSSTNTAWLIKSNIDQVPEC